MAVIEGRDHIRYYSDRMRLRLFCWALGIIGAGLFWGIGMFLGGASLTFLGWVLFGAGIVVIGLQPRYGIYLILFFTLLSDSFLIPWYPFIKNLSSFESIFYLNDSLIFSPLEIYIVITLLSWGARLWPVRRASFAGGRLGWPFALFALSLMAGIGYGLMQGGNLNTALWECRPMFYFPGLYFLTFNLIEERGQIPVLIWVAMLALGIEGLIGAHYVFVVQQGDLSGIEAVTDHAAAIHMNTVFVLLLALVIFRKTLPWQWAGVLLLVPGVAVTYLATQRRAAFVALGVALVLLAIVLYQENRRLFWIVVPPAALFGILYLAAFWNNSGLLGIPARGIRSVFFAEADSKDYSSNVSRIIENINTNFTIHRSPLFGVGFGKPFYIVATMPDISFFVWWQYITHNSVLWVWMKAGFFGFFSLLFLLGNLILVGSRLGTRMPPDDLKAIGLTWMLYVIMHFVYAYVDMSWDSQSTVYLGVAAGGLGALERIAAQPWPEATRRWRWQKLPPVKPILKEM